MNVVVNMSFTFYEVGGRVRDEILGLESKDIDYVAVPNADLINDVDSANTMFNILEEYLRGESFEIFLTTPDCFTIRAKFPVGHKHQGVADFVMARKEVGYIPGTRTPIVKPGTLFDDLERRDFTLNAIAKDSDGNLIDYFKGIEHLKKGYLITPLDCHVTFNDDPLRILRAIRFCITKGFWMSPYMEGVIQDYDYDNKMSVVSTERIREELYKCFKADTNKTLRILHDFPALRNYIFEKTTLWLKPTMEDK
jgi:tRNA nucleotidyltransferase/poly(A) polymerase